MGKKFGTTTSQLCQLVNYVISVETVPWYIFLELLKYYQCIFFYKVENVDSDEYFNLVCSQYLSRIIN